MKKKRKNEDFKKLKRPESINIEEKKDELNLQDYGISQTTLEQVFNMHAAAEEELKQGANYEVPSGGILACLSGK